MNAVPAKYQSTSPARDQATINYLTFQVANPLYGIPQVTAGMTGQRVNREQLLRPYPQFTSITTQESVGKRWSTRPGSGRAALQGRVHVPGVLHVLPPGGGDQLPQRHGHRAAQGHRGRRPPSHLRDVRDRRDPVRERPALGYQCERVHRGPDRRLAGGLFYRVQSGNPIGFGNFLFKEGYPSKTSPSPETSARRTRSSTACRPIPARPTRGSTPRRSSRQAPASSIGTSGRSRCGSRRSGRPATRSSTSRSSRRCTSGAGSCSCASSATTC